MKKITVSPGNSTYDSRNDCNGIIETATNTLIVGFPFTVIPNTVYAIAGNAYGNNASAVESVVISDSVVEIGTCAFSCTHIKEIVLPASIKKLNRCAFNNNAFHETIEFKGESTKYIDGFTRCPNIKRVIVPFKCARKFKNRPEAGFLRAYIEEREQ